MNLPNLRFNLSLKKSKTGNEPASLTFPAAVHEITSELNPLAASHVYESPCHLSGFLLIIFDNNSLLLPVPTNTFDIHA